VIEPGRSLWVEHGERWILGEVVSHEQGKGVDLRAEGGEVRRVREADVRLVSARPPGTSLAAHRQRVEAFEREARRQIAELWEILCEEGEGPEQAWELDELASFVARPEDGAFFDAVRRALQTDEVYFKRRAGRLAPGSPRQVAERRKQLEARQVREAKESALASALLGALEQGGAAGEVAPELHEALRLLDVAAAHGLEHPHHDRAVSLARRALGAVSSDASTSAFDALVRLGVYDPDENLLLRRHGIRVEHPAAVEVEAAELAEGAARSRGPLLEDLRPLAIDDAETLDVDDALAVEDAGGSYVLHVLISDVAGRVPLGSACAEEARKRGGSLYLPERRIAMLPEILSEGVLSLREGAERDVLDFRISLTREGRPYDVRIRPARVRIARQLTYDEVDAVLAGERQEEPEVTARLRLLAELAGKLRAERVRAGAVVWQPDEYKVRVDDGGGVRISRAPSDAPSRRLVAEAMVLAGAMAARFCKEHGIPAVYRIQEGEEGPELPSREAAVGRPALADIFARFRKMRPAELRMQPGRHYGLGVSSYLQVTSPIRRFQDYVMHVQLRSYACTGYAPLRPDDLLRQFAALEEQIRTNQRIMRESEAYWILKHYAARVGETVRAEVIAEVGERLRLFLLDSGYQTLWSPERSAPPGQVVELRIAGANPRTGRLVLEAA